jgi:hypothetical protein
VATQPRLKDKTFERAEAFLASRGVHPSATGDYDVEAIVDAIRERGYEATFARTDGEWTVYFTDLLGPSPERHEVIIDPDLTTALLSALDLAVIWMTPEEEHKLFDERARKEFGLSGQEFLRRYDAGELDPDDPSVVHLLMARPLDR